MALPLVNTWQNIRGDDIPPVIVGDGATAFAVLDSNVVVSGLSASDNELGNISSYISPVSLPYTGYIGPVDVEFAVRDRWGNSAFKTIPVEVLGPYILRETPYYEDFNTPGVGEFWEVLRGQFVQPGDGTMQPTGSIPSSPRWNAVYFGDSNAHVQAVFDQNGSATIGGIIFRYINEENFYYLNFDGGNAQTRVVKRFDGVYSDVLNISNIVAPASGSFMFSVRMDADNFTILYEGVEVGSFVDADHLYGRGHGLIFTSDAQEVSDFRIARSDPGVDVLEGGITFAESLIPPQVGALANAGQDQTVNAGQIVSITAAASLVSGEDKEIVYFWTPPEGVVLSSETDETVTFTAPEAYSEKRLAFKLTASEYDTGGTPPTLPNTDPEVLTSEDTVVITVRATKIITKNSGITARGIRFR